MVKLTKLKIENYDFGVVQNSMYAFHLNHIFPPLGMAWLHKLSREMTPENTLEAYCFDLQKFYRFLLDKQGFTEIPTLEFAKDAIEKIEFRLLVMDRELIEGFSGYCSEIGNKKITVSRAFAAIAEFSKFLYEYGFTKYQRINKETINGILSDYKTTHGITTQVRTQYISPEDFESIILNQSWTPNKFIQNRNELALSLRYRSGLRTFELFELGNFDVSRLRKKFDDIPVGGFNLSIIGKRDKQRDIYLDSDTVLMLKNYLRRYLKGYKSGCIFATAGKNKRPLTSKSFHKEAFKNSINYYLQNNTGISQKDRELWENKNPYGLRHSFATNECIRMILNDEPYEILLKDLMGHESFATTQNYIQFAYLLISSHPERYSQEQIKHAQYIADKGREDQKKRDRRRGNKNGQ